MAATIEAANATLIGDGDLDRISEFFAADYVAHLTDQDASSGRDVIRSTVGLYRRAFPDLQVQVDILVEAEDRVAWQRTLRGTQQGAFKGFPATGRSIAWRDGVTSRLVDGLIAEEWVISDLAERLLLARKR